ncbi:uncharacterized protein LOC143669213 [Tamandua tetradactyla]|uniref:uncharacterized protein LOC143669213 n=1 Tax=Tamandua tetradactyla TaxID=48850 RepID=UPI0040539F5C
MPGRMASGAAAEAAGLPSDDSRLAAESRGLTRGSPQSWETEALLHCTATLGEIMAATSEESSAPGIEPGSSGMAGKHCYLLRSSFYRRRYGGIIKTKGLDLRIGELGLDPRKSGV